MGKVECGDGRTCASLCDGNPECPGEEDEKKCNGNVPHFPLVLQLRYGLCCLNLQIRSLPFRVRIKGLSEWTIM